MVMSLHNAYLTMVTFLPGEAAWTELASLPRSFTGWKEDEGDWRKINWGEERLSSRGENWFIFVFRGPSSVSASPLANPA